MHNQPKGVEFIADRLEGKAMAREEHGEPGDFDSISTEQARKVLGLGKCRNRKDQYRDPTREPSDAS